MSPNGIATFYMVIDIIIMGILILAFVWLREFEKLEEDYKAGRFTEDA